MRSTWPPDSGPDPVAEVRERLKSVGWPKRDRRRRRRARGPGAALGWRDEKGQKRGRRKKTKGGVGRARFSRGGSLSAEDDARAKAARPTGDSRWRRRSGRRQLAAGSKGSVLALAPATSAPERRPFSPSFASTHPSSRTVDLDDLPAATHASPSRSNGRVSRPPLRIAQSHSSSGRPRLAARERRAAADERWSKTRSRLWISPGLRSASRGADDKRAR